MRHPVRYKTHCRTLALMQKSYLEQIRQCIDELEYSTHTLITKATLCKMTTIVDTQCDQHFAPGVYHIAYVPYTIRITHKSYLYHIAYFHLSHNGHIANA